MASGFTAFEPSFAQARERIQQQFWFAASDWICTSGLWPSGEKPECLVLKLLKKHWCNDESNSSGIFFSMWIDDKDLSRMRFNIHALKLRELNGYALESRKFAAAFRKAFLPMSHTWPQFRTDFGPQTLIEGVLPAVPETSEDLLFGLTAQFVTASAVIDKLLLEAKAVVKGQEAVVKGQGSEVKG
jgi:hypothetical protein